MVRSMRDRHELPFKKLKPNTLLLLIRHFPELHSHCRSAVWRGQGYAGLKIMNALIN